MLKKFYHLYVLIFTQYIFGGCCCKNCCCHHPKANLNFNVTKRNSDLNLSNNILNEYFKSINSGKIKEEVFSEIKKLNDVFRKMPRDEFNLKYSEYRVKINKAISRISKYEIDTNKINIYNDFPDNYKVSDQKCFLECNYNCWLNAPIVALFSIKKFGQFLINTKFNKGTGEDRFNLLKDLFNLYCTNDNLDSKVINKYRDMIALGIFFDATGLPIAYNSKRLYEFNDHFIEWNNSHNFFDYFRIGDIFCEFTDYILLDLHSYLLYTDGSICTDKPNPKQPGMYKFVKDDFTIDKRLNYQKTDIVGNFILDLLPNEFEYKVLYNKEGEAYVDFLNLKGLDFIDIFFFTNNGNCKSAKKLEAIINDDNIEKKYIIHSFLLVAAQYHIVSLVKDTNGNFRIYDGLSRRYGEVINLNDEFKGKPYIHLNGYDYYPKFCFCEVIYLN